MACYYPIHGYRSKQGRFQFSSRGAISKMVVPCGGCVGCRLKRAGEWAVRGTHEAQLHLDNVFLTLTYDSKRMPDRPIGHIPADVGLYYPDFQDFMKRLRERFGYPDLRYIVSGEYGDKLGRPHFHAIFFNFKFPDKYYWYTSKQGHKVYRSKILEELWPWGNSEIGSVTAQSIAYVARYVMKKQTGKAADSHYEWFDKETGEVFWREPEFAHYSTKPAIGHDWFMKFHESVYPHDYIIFNGKKVRPPRYYDKLFVRMTGQCIKRGSGGVIEEFDIHEFSEAFDAIKATRIESAQKMLDDCTPERLAVREQVTQARVSSLKRKLT